MYHPRLPANADCLLEATVTPSTYETRQAVNHCGKSNNRGDEINVCWSSFSPYRNKHTCRALKGIRL